MLETNKPLALTGGELSIGDSTSPSEMFSSFIGFVRRQFPVILSVVLLISGLACVYLLTAQPRFTGNAVMLIDASHQMHLFHTAAEGGLTDEGTSAMVESQVEILKSENIALSVIKDLHLTEDPEFSGPSGGLIGTLVGFVDNLFTANEPKSEYMLTRHALTTFASRLTVTRIGLTYVMKIGFQSSSPERAAQIANAIADAYVLDQLDAKYQSTKRAGIWLQDRIKELLDQASTAERAVVEYKAKNNIVAAGGRLINEQQLAELNSQLLIARSQTSEAKSRLDRIESVLRADSPGVTVDATVADTLKNDVITKLRSQYLDLANREADWSNRYGRTHLAVVNLQNQMREISHSIISELRRIAESYKSDYAIAKQNQESIERELSSTVSESQLTNEAQIKARELESSAETYRALHDNFLQRYMETVQQESFPITESRLITKATPPLQKSYPNTLIVIAITGFGGLMLGLGAGLLRDLWERVFRTGAQVESILEVSCLAILPILKDGDAIRTVYDSNGKAKASGARNIVRCPGHYWDVVDSPLSRYAESIRSIRVAIDLYISSTSNKVIGFTSALPNEGKSTTAASLAQILSQAGAKTILVDCDFRNPSLTRGLAPDAKVGILELIAGKASLEEVVWTNQVTKLTFLPAVVKSRFAQTSDILASKATKELFDKLRERFDYIVVDLSPLAPVVDVRTTRNFVDSYVLVIEWGRTNIDMVTHTLNDARSVYENLVGAVLNKADVSVLARYESYRGGSHYYKGYYQRYGYTE